MRHASVFWIFVWMGVVALGCNLTATPADRPPTLVPNRPGNTPQPTIGYSTPMPNDINPEINGTDPEQVPVSNMFFNLHSQVESDRLMSHIYALEGFHTRHVNSSQTDPDRGVGAARSYIYQQLQNVQAQANGFFTVQQQPFQAFFNDQESTQYNIIGVLNGTEVGGGTIIVGAHYDSRTDDLNDGEGFAPGADDNGSGVAAVLELARVMSRNPSRASIMFVLFAAEEVNRQGSRAFVNEYIQPNNVDVIAMLNLDTIGSINSSSGEQNDYEIRLYSDEDNRSPARQLARTIEFISTHHQLPLAIDIKADSDREGRYGDHFSFVEANYPAVRFIEALEDNFNREGRDTRDHVEPDYLVKTTQTVLSVLIALADGPRPPRQVVIRSAGTYDENGNLMYSLIWDQVPGANSYVVALRRPGSMIYDQIFSWPTTQTDPWGGFTNFEAIAVAAVDENGLVGPVSQEFNVSSR